MSINLVNRQSTARSFLNINDGPDIKQNFLRTDKSDKENRRSSRIIKRKRVSIFPDICSVEKIILKPGDRISYRTQPKERNSTINKCDLLNYKESDIIQPRIPNIGENIPNSLSKDSEEEEGQKVTSKEIPCDNRRRSRSTQIVDKVMKTFKRAVTPQRKLMDETQDKKVDKNNVSNMKIKPCEYEQTAVSTVNTPLTTLNKPTVNESDLVSFKKAALTQPSFPFINQKSINDFPKTDELLRQQRKRSSSTDMFKEAIKKMKQVITPVKKSKLSSKVLENRRASNIFYDSNLKPSLIKTPNIIIEPFPRNRVKFSESTIERDKKPSSNMQHANNKERSIRTSQNQHTPEVMEKPYNSHKDSSFQETMGKSRGTFQKNEQPKIINLFNSYKIRDLKTPLK